MSQGTADLRSRKIMLAAQVREKFGGRPGAPGFYILVALADSLDGFCKVLSEGRQLVSLAVPLLVGRWATAPTKINSGRDQLRSTLVRIVLYAMVVKIDAAVNPS